MSRNVFENVLVEDANVVHSEPGDHDKMSHYVQADKLTDAMVLGIPLKALCGKFWVPTRDGLKFPVCPECKEKWEKLRDE